MLRLIRTIATWYYRRKIVVNKIDLLKAIDHIVDLEL